jgi:CheY-like chemotaxis protein
LVGLSDGGPSEHWGPKSDRGEIQAGTVQKLAGGYAHDLNNVLTVIVGNIALAERHAAGNPKLIRLLANMRLATDRGTVLAQGLMALSPGHVPDPSALPGFSEPTARSRILVVEDDPSVAEVAVAVLEDMGHAVDVGSNAAAALALLERGAYDLVFSDIVMPGGMSGIELAEVIATSFPRLPVLLATGYSTAALAPGALRFPVLAKPYSVQELARRVTQMLPVQPGL